MEAVVCCSAGAGRWLCKVQAVFATETSGGSSGTLISGQVRGGGTGLSLHTPAARDTRAQDTQDTQDTEDT